MENAIQKPMYYVSKSLQEAKTRFLPLEKAVPAIIHATNKLPHYFHHTVVVLTQLSLQALLQKLGYTGRMAKWGTMLRAFDVKYMPHTAIKGQVLVDFITEFTEDVGEDKRLGISTMMVSAPSSSIWEVYTNGAANQMGSRVGIILVTPKKLVVEKSLQLGFLATNNEAEYEALLAGMEMVARFGGEILHIYSDSRLWLGKSIENLKPGTKECRAKRGSKSAHQPMALCPMGLGNSWTLPKGHRKSTVALGRN
ncbi:uncharacterized protein LOC142630229 [Castanea sativa]|uniref:uncharacterized protein LOC142630229 n=1 Tax=Castanea sativa TaxID=21020 RepID=UPI003F6547E8